MTLKINSVRSLQEKRTRMSREIKNLNSNVSFVEASSRSSARFNKKKTRSMKEGTVTFTCKLCHKNFLSKLSLSRHQVWHKIKPKNVSNESNEIDLLPQNQDEEKNLICDLCKQSFQYFPAFCRHRKRCKVRKLKRVVETTNVIDTYSDASIVSCEGCKKTFVSILYLRRHMKRCRAKKYIGTKGRNKSKKLNKNTEIPAQIKIVSDKKKIFACEKCNKSFSFKQNVKRHEVKCSGEVSEIKTKKLIVNTKKTKKFTSLKGDSGINKAQNVPVITQMKKNEPLKITIKRKTTQDIPTCDICLKTYKYMRSMRNHREKCILKHEKSVKNTETTENNKEDGQDNLIPEPEETQQEEEMPILTKEDNTPLPNFENVKVNENFETEQLQEPNITEFDTNLVKINIPEPGTNFVGLNKRKSVFDQRNLRSNSDCDIGEIKPFKRAKRTRRIQSDSNITPQNAEQNGGNNTTQIDANNFENFSAGSEIQERKLDIFLIDMENSDTSGYKVMKNTTVSENLEVNSDKNYDENDQIFDAKTPETQLEECYLINMNDNVFDENTDNNSDQNGGSQRSAQPNSYIVTYERLPEEDNISDN